MSEQRVIELHEWEKAKRVPLTAEENDKLRALAARLDVRWHGGGEASISGKAGYVGMAALSEDTQVIVRPHIPIASVLQLACYAYELEPPGESLIEDARLDDTGPADWLAFLLTLEVEKLLGIGLRRGYREVEEEIPYVRGRIDFGTLRWGESKPGLVPCRFEDFVVDTLENRILRGTLEILSSSLLSGICRRMVRSALAAFSQVRLVQPTTLMFHRVALTRMTHYYGPALALCRLVLESAGIELEAGDVSTPGFFFNMADVFEKAIDRSLREEFGTHNILYQPQYRDRIRVIDGEPATPVTFIPDNVIGPRDAPWLIVDAKYKNPLRWRGGTQYFVNEDLYQAFTYAAALDAPAVLVYPRVDRGVDVTLDPSLHAVQIRTVDLLERRPFELELGGIAELAQCPFSQTKRQM
jgi:5-methylcytosine-specific restriction enzyme subunit McrC